MTQTLTRPQRQSALNVHDGRRGRRVLTTCKGRNSGGLLAVVNNLDNLSCFVRSLARQDKGRRTMRDVVLL